MSFGFFSFVRSAARTAAGGASLLLLLSAASLSAAEGNTSGNGASSPGGLSDSSAGSMIPARDFKVPEAPNRMGDLFMRNDPMPRLSAPRPRPAQPTKRSILDDPNWGFATPEDIVQEYMSKNIARLPDFTSDGRDRNTMSPVERYYDRQMRGGGSTNSAASVDGFEVGVNLNGINGVATVPGQSIRSLNSFRNINPYLAESPSRPDGLSDLLGLRNNPYSPEAIREHDASQRQVDAFRRALEVQPAGGISGLPKLTPTYSESKWTGGAASFAPAVPKNPYDTVAGTYNPAFAVAAPVAPVAPSAPTAPGQSKEASLTPSTASRIAPPKPDFSLPQRRF